MRLTIALGKAGPFPDIAEQHVVGEIDQLGRERAQRVAPAGSYPVTQWVA